MPHPRKGRHACAVVGVEHLTVLDHPDGVLGTGFEVETLEPHSARWCLVPGMASGATHGVDVTVNRCAVAPVEF